VREDGYLLPRKQTLLAMSGVLLGMLLAALNQTIVATALPRIVGDLGGVEHYSWVFSAYMLGATVTTPIYGRLSDVYGRRRFFVAGILIFMAGAVVAGTASSMTQLVLGRAIQGIGAGSLIPLAVATIGDLIPPSERGRWQGLTGAVFGFASVIGPTTGGWISDHADWRWVFFVSLPVGVLALIVVSATLKIPPHPDRGTKVDYAGAALLAFGLSSGLLAIVQGGPIELYAIAAGVLALFVWWERRVEQPVVPIELFSERVFTASNLAAFSVGVGMFGAIMFVPLFVQGVMGASATASGIVLTPLMLSMMATSVGSGQVITRTGRYRWALILGPLVMGLGFLLLATMSVSSGRGHATVAMIVTGLGLGLLIQNLSLVIQNGVPSRHLGAATSAAQFFRSIGGTIGVSVMGAILAARLPAGGEASPDQLASAIHPVFVFGVPLMAVTLAIVLTIPELPLRRTVREMQPPPVAEARVQEMAA
jgi:EmrB/QacA subfamily drug resistance transporter